MKYLLLYALVLLSSVAIAQDPPKTADSLPTLSFMVSAEHGIGWANASVVHIYEGRIGRRLEIHTRNSLDQLVVASIRDDSTKAWIVTDTMAALEQLAISYHLLDSMLLRALDEKYLLEELISLVRGGTITNLPRWNKLMTRYYRRNQYKELYPVK